MLVNHRSIYLKDWKPRLIEELLTEKMKENILNSGTKFQIGGVLGHRIEEHLIVLKSLIQEKMRKKEGGVVQLVDFKNFFDSERLRAIMISLNHANVNKKAYRCWFKMNETMVISVDTPVGRTNEATVHEIVPQGSGGAALASAMHWT